MAKSKAAKPLTEVELELMNIVWDLGEATVNDVLSKLSTSRKLAYTSVSTMLRILEHKEVLRSRKEGRSHIYFPRVKRHDYESISLNNLVRKVFMGEPAAVVRQLLNNKDLTEEDLREIKELLDERLS